MRVVHGVQARVSFGMLRLLFDGDLGRQVRQDGGADDFDEFGVGPGSPEKCHLSMCCGWFSFICFWSNSDARYFF